MSKLSADEALQESQAMNRLLLEIVKTQKRNIKDLLRIFVITVVCYTILLLAMIGSLFWSECKNSTIPCQAVVEVSSVQNTPRAEFKNNVRKRRMCKKATTSIA